MCRKNHQISYLNLDLLTAFFKLHKYLFPSWKSDTFWCFLALLLTASIEQFLIYRVGLISGAFYEILGNKNEKGFVNHVIFSLALLVSITLFKSIRSFLAKIIGVMWRKHLTKFVHRLYFSNLTFYKLTSFGEHKIDNPDQRISSDIQIFCSSYSSIIMDLILCPILVIYYGYDAYSRADWIGPTGILALFLISLLINRILMSAVIQATVQLEKSEGNFRFAHANIRSNSESLAFCGPKAAQFEMDQQLEKLKNVCTAQFNVFKAQFVLEMATNGNAYISSIASFLIIAFPILNGTYDSLTQPELAKMISETSFVCMQLSYYLSKLVEMSVQVSQMLGVTFRIDEMVGEMECRGTNPNQDEDFDEKMTLPDETVLKIQNLSVLTPEKTPTCLVDKLSLDLKPQTNLLINGPSSSGKTSLMRVIAQLWPSHSGFCIHQKEPYFMPQNPYLCYDDVTIRQQITFPEKEPNFDKDHDIKKLLNDFGLERLLTATENNLDSMPSKEWVKKLSPGERQILAFVRLIYHRPKMAFLDEASSALSVTSEAKMYQECTERGIQLISIGHRPTLVKFHQLILKIGLKDGTWTICDNIE